MMQGFKMGMGFAMFGAAAAEKFQRIVEFWAIRPPSLLALGVFRAHFSVIAVPEALLAGFHLVRAVRMLSLIHI